MSTPQSLELVPAGPSPRGVTVTADDFMPLLSTQKALARKEALNHIIKEVLIEGVDYGIQPGSANEQKVLKKSGAEKLCSVFGLAPRIVEKVEIEDWSGADHGGEPFFYFKYTIALYRGDLFLGEATGSCNSWETKYRWRWVTDAEAKDRPDYAKLVKRGGRRKVFEPDFAIDKAETTGRYGKPAAYWTHFRSQIEAGGAQRITKRKMGTRIFDGWELEIDDLLVRVPNPNPADVVNTVQKMAYKRALVAPVLVVTNCSDAFTQDLDEEIDETQMRFTPAEHEPPTNEAAAKPEPAKSGASAPAAQSQPKAATPPAERVVPEEMQLMVEAIRRDPNVEIKRSYDIMWAAFQRRGTKAMEKHEEITKKFRDAYPRTAPLQRYIDNLLDLHEALQEFEEVPRT